VITTGAPPDPTGLASAIDGESLGPGIRAGGSLAAIWARYRRPLAIAIGCTAVLRIMVGLVALLAKYASDFPHVIAHNPGVLDSVFFQWDVGQYAAIAVRGYPAGPIAHGAQNSIAFAPMLPFLERLTHVVTGLGGANSGMLVSLVALVAALTGLHRLIALDHPAAVADTTVVLLLAWPLAFFFLVGYPESLALALVVWAFLAARSRQWLAVGLLVAGACLTKYYLLLVLVPLVYELWVAHRSEPTPLKSWVVRGALLIGPAVVAIGGWMMFCAIRFDDPLAFVHAQAGWNRSLAWPWDMVTRTGGDLWHLRFLDTSVASTDELVSTVTVVLMVVATVSAFSNLRRSYALFLAVATALFVCNTILESTGREVLVLFPLFLVFATWCERHPWLERLLFALFLPTAYYLIERFVTVRFAG